MAQYFVFNDFNVTYFLNSYFTSLLLKYNTLNYCFPTLFYFILFFKICSFLLLYQMGNVVFFRTQIIQCYSRISQIFLFLFFVVVENFDCYLLYLGVIPFSMFCCYFFLMDDNYLSMLQLVGKINDFFLLLEKKIQTLQEHSF